MGELDFTAIKQALLDWPSAALPQTGASNWPLLGRLQQVLETARTRGSFESLPDLMVLVRQLLLSRSGSGVGERLSVPQYGGWPSSDLWEKFGCRVTKTATRFLLEPTPWRPSWLGPTNGEQEDLFLPEHRAELARRDASLPMDPFLREVTGFETYVCPGQREAVLSALFLPAGEALIVNLPTGSGKSLVAQAPALVRGPGTGLTLVVVPTNALALDLERRTQELFIARDSDWEPYELAWIGTRPDTSHDEIKERVRAGSQSILFASPEAACGPLLHSLYIAAEKGLLSYLVVDEAHLIAQWGDAFRPAFQKLSGVRRGLLKSSPRGSFRTLLLSATFSPQVIGTLEVLFGPHDRLQMVSAVHLRPEPRYLSCQVDNRQEKLQCLDDLLRYIPRPFILYATTRQDAKDWFKRLRWAGFRRIACVHGGTGNHEREVTIREWAEDRLDGIVATSAFGVGMDKADVRTVIHGALPETLDRFYQEVGRGGRDGRASLSITLFDSRDIDIARGLTVPTLIGDERGFERWSTLYHEAERDSVDPEIRLVDLRKRPGGLLQESDYNRDWNMRTLIFLARAGLIQLESAQPLKIERTAEEDDASFKARVDAAQEGYFARLPIRCLDPRLMNRSHFELRVGNERMRGIEAATQAFHQMLGAMKGQREMSEVLVGLFASDSVVVSPACRGCPASGGELHEGGTLYQIPTGIGISRLNPYDDESWRRRFDDLDPSLVVIMCPNNAPQESLWEALRVAVSSFGARELVLQPSLSQSESGLLRAHRWADDHVLVLRKLEDAWARHDTLPLPRITVLLPWEDGPLPDYLLLLDRPLHLVFAPTDIQDPQHPLRSFRDTSTNCIDLSEFLRRATR